MLTIANIFRQFGNLPKRGWCKVGAWLGHKTEIQGHGWGKVGAWLVQARMGHGWGMVGARGMVRARLRHGLCKVAARNIM